MIDAFFTADGAGTGEVLLPRPAAASRWGGPVETVRGVAVSGALARAAEHAVADLGAATEVRPARWTVDLFRPTTLHRPATATARVVRAGRRLCVVEAQLVQDDRAVARASGLFLAPGGTSVGATWSGDPAPAPPPPHLRPASAEPRLFWSEGVGWTATPHAHANAARKQLWNLPTAVVDGEEPTPFQHAAMVADLASMVGNWGDAGIEFINADLTLALARLPAGVELGLATEHRMESDGIAVVTALMFDHAGAFGSVTVTALANGRHAIDPRQAFELPRGEG